MNRFPQYLITAVLPIVLAPGLTMAAEADGPQASSSQSEHRQDMGLNPRQGGSPSPVDAANFPPSGMDPGLADVQTRIKLVRQQVLLKNGQGFYDSEATARRLLRIKGAAGGIYVPASVGLMFQEADDTRLHDRAFNLKQANYVLGVILADFQANENPKLQYQGKPARMLFRRWVLLDLLANESANIDPANKALFKDAFEKLDYRIGAQGLGNTANMKLLTALSRFLAGVCIPDFRPAPSHDRGMGNAVLYLNQRINDTFYFGPDEWASAPYGAQNLLPMLTLARRGGSETDPMASRAMAAFNASLLKYAADWGGGYLITQSERTYPSFIEGTTDQSGLRQALWPFFGGWSRFYDDAQNPGAMSAIDSPSVFVAYALGKILARPGVLPPEAFALAALDRKQSIMAHRERSERRCISYVDWKAGYGVYSHWSKSGTDTVAIPAGVVWSSSWKDRNFPSNFWLGVVGAGLQGAPHGPDITSASFSPTGTLQGMFINTKIQRWGQIEDAFVLLADTLSGYTFAHGPNGEDHAFVTGFVPSQWVATQSHSMTQYAEDYSLAGASRDTQHQPAPDAGGCYRLFLAFRTVDPSNAHSRGVVIAVTSSQPIVKFTPDDKGVVKRNGLSYANHSIFTDSSFYIDVPVIAGPDRRAVGVAVEAIPLPEDQGNELPLEKLLARIKESVMARTQFHFTAEANVFSKVSYRSLRGNLVERSFDSLEKVPEQLAVNLWEVQMVDGKQPVTFMRQSVEKPNDIEYSEISNGQPKAPLHSLIRLP